MRIFYIFLFRETVESELKTANQQQALGIAILLLVLIISPIIIFLVRWALILDPRNNGLNQERDGHHPHLLLDPLHEGAGARAGETEDGRSALPDIATPGCQILRLFRCMHLSNLLKQNLFTCDRERISESHTIFNL